MDYVNTLYESIELVWKIRILLVYFTFLFWAKRMNILIAGENCVKLKISDSHPEPAFDPIDCGCGDIFKNIVSSDVPSGMTGEEYVWPFVEEVRQ